MRLKYHDDVIKWTHFPRYWPFVRGIHRSPVNSPQKGRRRGALKFSLICAWTNGWVNSRDAGDLRRHRAHYDVTVMRYIYTIPSQGMSSGDHSVIVRFLHLIRRLCTCRWNKLRWFGEMIRHQESSASNRRWCSSLHRVFLPQNSFWNIGLKARFFLWGYNAIQIRSTPKRFLVTCEVSNLIGQSAVLLNVWSSQQSN